jgi:hypothetical protein
VSYGNYFPFYNFFGIGNNTQKTEELYDARYYHTRYKGFTVQAFSERVFWQRSVFRVGPSYEHYNADYATASQLGQDLRQQLPGLDNPRPNADFQRLAGLNALLDVDLRTAPRLPSAACTCLCATTRTRPSPATSVWSHPGLC